MSMRRLATPRPARIACGPGGAPCTVGTRAVETVCEDWVVEDRWWTGKPVRRRYFELVLDDGRNTVVFRDLPSGRWFTQPA